MKQIIFSIIITLVGIAANAQTVTSSPLPIVLIQTDGNATIPDAYKVCGTMKILYVNDTTTNYLANQDSPAYIHYEGRIGIEKRGSTSQDKNKRHYGFETRQSDDVTNDNVSLLGMPEENDWILNPLNYDNTYLRDPLSYTLARLSGHYAPRTHYCEVFVGGNYRGIYFLTEKIKADKNRVNVAKLDSTENTMPKLSGGYIVKADKTTGGDVVAWSTPAHDCDEDVNYIFHFPKPELITNQQANYIESYFDTLQAIMDRHDSTIASGYPSVIDIPTFIDYMIIAELTSNVDIYQKSTFFHKDRMGKLCAGPVWDFNAAYGNDPFANPGRSGYNVWQFDNGDNTGSEFWYQLFHDTQYHRLLARRWHELTAPGAPLCLTNVESIIDSLNAEISSLVSRDKQRWGYYFNQTTAVNNIKTWLQNRYNWLNNQLTDTIDALPGLPNLAFTKIHYNPQRRGSLSSDKQEFIAITNLSDAAVSLTGIYLSQLGISYQFPANSVIDSAQEIYIAADTAAFRTRYGVGAFGKFSRNLNNHSQRLVLADAWGRVIDDVTYSDDGSWPTEADGSGPFLTLLDPTADNSDGSNWSTDTTLLPIAPCVVPTDLVVSDIEYYSATLSWAADSSQSLWQIAIAYDNHFDTLTSQATSYRLTGLAPGSTYRVAVLSQCDETHASLWSDTIEFTTEQCPVVENVAVEIQGNTAHVSWDSHPDAIKWIVAYGPEGTNPYQGTSTRVSNPNIQLSGLAPGTYNLYVLADCDSNNYSAWSDPTIFEIIPTESITSVAEPSVTLSPNPASQQVSITLEGYNGPIELTMIDMYGRTVKQESCSTTPTLLDLSGIAKGVYLLTIRYANTETVQKLIIQ